METLKSDAGNEFHLRATKLVNEAMQMWGSLAAFSVAIFWFFSSGDFSFLLTLSSLVSVSSFLMMAVVVKTRKSAAGVSLKMMECYPLVFICRLCTILKFEAYLPMDKSGDWVYQVCEAAGLCLSIWIVYSCRMTFKTTYDPEADKFNHLWIILPALGISCVAHPHLADFPPCDIAWAFALYLESVAVLPQFLMFLKERRTQPHTSHFLAAQALARLMSFIFWTSTFFEGDLDHDHYLHKYAAHWIVFVQLAQLLIMGDFLYHYIKCIRMGIPVSELGAMFVDSV